MTRRLILTRHAKSSWDDPLMEDFDRPLNRRGRRSADALGQWLSRHDPHPEDVLVSSAVRTQETWSRIARHLRPPHQVTITDDLYHATPETMRRVLSQAEGDTVLLIAHNPGIAALASGLIGTPPPHIRFHDYPTGATTIMTFEVDTWAEIAPRSGLCIEFIVPRDLID